MQTEQTRDRQQMQKKRAMEVADKVDSPSTVIVDIEADAQVDKENKAQIADKS